jgi:nucleoid-associated protein YejK
MNIEISRSYSEKVNMGNYQTFDSFCSAKCEVDEKEADQKSKELYEFCKEQVKKEIKEHREEVEKLKEEYQGLVAEKKLNFKDVKLNGD